MASGVVHGFIGAVPDEWQLYSDKSTDYSLGEPIGFGASSTVYSAIYNPSSSSPVPCALKVLDLDSLPPHALRLLQRETTLMSLSKHPNVLRVRGTWMDGHKLYIAMRLMSKGSAADVMRYGWPGGMEEEVVRCILKQALEGLNYLHINGFIHRDVKAANLLIDDDGTVLLGDLGVAASLHLADDLDPTHHHKPLVTAVENNKRLVNFAVSQHVRPKMGKRKSFVGTPCWMSPELIQGHHYDSSSDMWSFGITALELTQGRPPRSRESPSAVLLKTVQNAPPSLDREGGLYKYSRAFKELVDSCLLKDPSKRPTAQQLLQTPFFKNAKKKSYLVGAILHDLPPLTSRQERRRQPSHPTHRSIDSWDFSHTPQLSIIGRPISSLGGNSPTTSVYRSRNGDWAVREEQTEEEEDLDIGDGDMSDWTGSVDAKDLQDKAARDRGLIGDSSDSSAVSEEGFNPASEISPASSVPEESGCIPHFASTVTDEGRARSGQKEDPASTVRKTADCLPVLSEHVLSSSQSTTSVSPSPSSAHTKSPSRKSSVRNILFRPQSLSPSSTKSSAGRSNGKPQSIPSQQSPLPFSSTTVSTSAPSSLPTTQEASLWRKLTRTENTDEKVGNLKLKKRNTIGNLFASVRSSKNLA